ncbi:PilZ domain-containing protein [Rhizobiales bacterium TNE-4]|nr:PilZ domain-containing protein [Rhizobiales bacterium TNE-4]MBV1827422.1 PilZ domain-containing protein [Rhizobiales bacterium TNE-4]
MTFMQSSAPLNVSEGERRRFSRVRIALAGRFMLADGTEHTCCSIDISPGSAAISADIRPPRGTRIILYLDRLGRLEGEVQRVFDDGFAISFSVSDAKKRRLAEDLTWLANRDLADFANKRLSARVEPAQQSATMVLEDGTLRGVTLIDVSLSGLGVRSELLPPIGSVIRIGVNRGRVVRHFEGGFGLSFAQDDAGRASPSEKITSNAMD